MPDREDRSPPDDRPERRTLPRCPDCDEAMRFDGGRQIHDLWAERFECPACGRETYRSYGRGSV